MVGKLKELKNKVFFGEHSDEEWIEINRSVHEEFKIANDEEKQEFIDSGAGNLLGQVIEFMD